MTDPSTIQIIHRAGTGDMGSLTYGTYVSGALDANDKARFFLPGGGPFIFVFLRVHFVGGTDTAKVYINVDSKRGPAYDAVIAEVKARGTGADCNYRIRDEEVPFSIHPAGDIIVPTWTDPDTTTWAAEAGLIPVVPDAT